MISACTVWFTFVFRTPIPRAVEDFIVEVLHDSRGSTLALRLPRIPHLYLDYITLLVICQDFFFKRGWLVRPPITTLPSSTVGQPLLYPYYITSLSTCQGVFCFFLRGKWIRTTIRSAQICNAESNRFASRSLSSASLCICIISQIV